MAKIVTLLTVLLFVSLLASAQRKISAEDAPKYYGETVTICDKIYGIEFAESSKSFTALKVGDSSRNSKMFVFLSPELLQKLTSNGKMNISNKSICVTGKIYRLKGLPEIIVSKEEEILLLSEGAANGDIRPNDFMRFN